MSHVDEGRLHAFLDGALSAADPADAERLELHLASCADCRAKLAEAARLRDEAGALLGAAVPAAFEVPSFDAIRARADAIAAGEAKAPDAGAGGPAGASGAIDRDRTSGRSRGAVFATPFNGLAWAASVVLAVGLGWLLHDTIEDPDIRPLSVSADRMRTRAEAPAPDAPAELAAAGMAEEGEAAAAPANAVPPTITSEPTRVPPAEAEPARTPPSYDVAMDGDAGAGAADVRQREPREEMQRAAEAPALADGGAAARRQAAATPPAPPPAAPSREAPLGQAAADSAVSAKQPQDDDAGWVAVTVEQARRATGDELAVLDGARLVSAATRGTGSALEVRTVQRTSRGEVVDVVQRSMSEAAPGEEAARRDAVSSRALVTGEAAQRPMAAAADRADADGTPAHWSSTVRWRDWTVTISATVGADRLGELVAELP